MCAGAESWVHVPPVWPGAGGGAAELRPPLSSLQPGGQPASCILQQAAPAPPHAQVGVSPILHSPYFAFLFLKWVVAMFRIRVYKEYGSKRPADKYRNNNDPYLFRLFVNAGQILKNFLLRRLMFKQILYNNWQSQK